MIHNMIANAAMEFEASTGKKPTNVYLGRNEMDAMLKWAAAHEYISSPEAQIEGDHRPEVHGLFVYKVNDDNHLAFS